MIELVLGLDPGIKNTGYAFACKHRRDLSITERMVRFGVIRTNSKWGDTERIIFICERLEEEVVSIQEVDYEVVRIVVEHQTLFNRRSKFRTKIDSTIKVQGAIIGWSASRSIEIITPTPIQWESRVMKGYKSDRKGHLNKLFRRKFSKPLVDHVTDAMGLALYGCWV